MKITLEHTDYPKQLRELKNKPDYLYTKGCLDALKSEKIIAIVGSRKMTSYAERVLDIFVPQLVYAGYIVVSGFMYGVDTYAHTLTVENGGRTIAVLGSGINSIYPKENEELYTKIVNTDGLVLSEYEPEQKPKPWMFAKRNRLIAALATSGVIVVEASLKSGSLITANRAIELDRPLYAVPGQITSHVSKGTNELISSGKAKILTDISQIIATDEPFVVSKESVDKLKFETKLQQKIYELLKNEDMSIDQITVKLDKNAQEISSCLMQMDFSGIITEDRGVFRIDNKN